MKIGKYETHEAADWFPMIDPKSAEFERLELSLEVEGQLEPIVLHNGKVLDGRNRLLIITEKQEAPETIEFRSLNLTDAKGSPLTPEDYVFSKNACRRNLSKDQMAVVFAHYDSFYAKRMEEVREMGVAARNSTGDEIITCSKRDKKTREKLAKAAGVGVTKAQDAMNIVRDAPEIAKEVAAGNVTLEQAKRKVKAEKAPMIKVIEPSKRPRYKNEDVALDMATDALMKIAATIDPTSLKWFYTNVKSFCTDTLAEVSETNKEGK